MTLKQWASNGWLRPHETSPKEIRDLLTSIDGVTFSKAWLNRVLAELDGRQGRQRGRIYTIARPDRGPLG